MKKFLSLAVVVSAVLVISLFMVRAFVRSSPPMKVAEPPVLNASPARVYGTIEPAGREVFVSPPQTKEVVKIFVKEGDRVKEGQTICVLDSEVERAQLQAAEARIEAAKQVLAITQDDMKRKKDLYTKKVDSEFNYTQARLQVELEQINITVALKEAALARSRIDQLELKSPIDGKVYKCDVRLGETLSAGDNTRIILGSPDLWVRLFVEAYWKDRVTVGSEFSIYNSETDEQIGVGTVIFKAPYMGRRNFRTEDSQERFDTKFQEVVLEFVSSKEDVPIGLSVIAELKQG